eukprot:11402-Eustigmatos_ZCMA.PRE.1
MGDVQTNAVLHLLEGPAEILTSLLRHFNLSSAGMSYKYDEVRRISDITVACGQASVNSVEAAGCAACLMWQIRILLSSEDCPERRLPCWTHHVLQSQ